jgi:hypothetical protein
MPATQTEIDIARAFVQARLEANTDLLALVRSPGTITRIYPGRIPQDFEDAGLTEPTNPYPAIVHSFVTVDGNAANRMYPNGPFRTMVPLQWDVAVDGRDVEVDDATLARILALADASLEGATGAVSGGYISNTQFIRYIPTVVIQKGFTFTRIGITYRIEARLT